MLQVFTPVLFQEIHRWLSSLWV